MRTRLSSVVTYWQPDVTHAAGQWRCASECDSRRGITEARREERGPFDRRRADSHSSWPRAGYNCGIRRRFGGETTKPTIPRTSPLRGSGRGTMTDQYPAALEQKVREFIGSLRASLK